MEIYNDVLNKMLIEKNERPKKKKKEGDIFEKKIDIKKPKAIKKKKYAKLPKRKNL